MLDILKLKNDIPLHIICYKEIISTPELPMTPLLNLLGPRDGRALCLTGRFEQKFLLKLFELNARRLHPKYQELVKQDTTRMPGYKASFVLPLGPISLRGLGKLTRDPGCDVCGKKGVRQCTQCLSASYCGKGKCHNISSKHDFIAYKIRRGLECQTLDWKKHKVTCRSVKGGTWRTFTFEIPPAFYQNIVGRQDTVPLEMNVPSDDSFLTREPPPDIHNGQIFLAKFQKSLDPPGDPTDILVYDRQRSFRIMWMRESETDLFVNTCALMGNKHKCYRWIKRVDDFSFAVCLDRAPAEDPLW